MDQQLVDQEVLVTAFYFFLAGAAAGAVAWGIAHVVTAVRLQAVTDSGVVRRFGDVVRHVSIAIGLNGASADPGEPTLARVLRRPETSALLFLFWLLFFPSLIVWAANGYQDVFAWVFGAALALSAARMSRLIDISQYGAAALAALGAAPIAMFAVPEVQASLAPVFASSGAVFGAMVVVILLAAGITWLAGLAESPWPRIIVAAAVMGAGLITALLSVRDVWLPYIGATLTLVFVLLTYLVWRWDSLDRRNRLSGAVARVETAQGWRRSLGLNIEMILATGVLAALPLLLLARLDADYKLFEDGNAGVYARYILGKLSETFGIGDAIDWLLELMDLQWKNPSNPYPEITAADGRWPDLVSLFISALGNFGWTIVVALVALGSAVALYGKLIAAQIRHFERKLCRILGNWKQDPGVVFEEARRAVWRGPTYVTAAIGVADKMITAELACRSERPQQPYTPESLHPAFLGYLLCAWQGDVQLRQRFLRTGLRLVGERLERLLEIVDPPFVNHLAVSETTGLPELVRQLRATRAQWASERAPLNKAAITNLLAIELWRIVESRWRLDDADQGELVALLNEAEELLQEALAVFAQTWSQADAAAVRHNLGTIQYLLALVRRDTSKIDQAIENFADAIATRDPPAGVFAQAGDLMMDAAASHAFSGLANGQRAVWSGEDNYAFRAVQHFERSIAILGGEADRLLKAGENHVAALTAAGKLACIIGAWETAMDFFHRAFTAASTTSVKPQVVDGIRLRLGYAAVRAAHDTLAQTLFGQESHPTASLPVLERAQRNLRRAQTQIGAVSEPKELRPLIRLKPRHPEDSRHDFMVRALFLVAGAKRWVANEFQLVKAACDCVADRKDTSGAKLAAVGLANGDMWESAPLADGDKPGTTDKNNAIVESDASTVRDLVTKLNRDVEPQAAA